MTRSLINRIRSLDAIRAEISRFDELRHEWSALGDLTDRYTSAHEGSTTRVEIGGQIADVVERVADHLESSWLARATTALPSPDELRVRAAEWRSGMYHPDCDNTPKGA